MQICNEELTSFQKFRGFFIKTRPEVELYEKTDFRTLAGEKVHKLQ